jgi:hypothetical protein
VYGGRWPSAAAQADPKKTELEWIMFRVPVVPLQHFVLATLMGSH